MDLHQGVRERGTTLEYQRGTTVVSPNGICECDDECCRGIHAFRTRQEAKQAKNKQERIVQVKGKWWAPYRGSRKVRAVQVDVLD